MKYVVVLICGLLICAASFADEPLEGSEREVVEVVVTAQKIAEPIDKPQVEDEEIQSLILADLSRRLREARKQI